MLTLAGVLTSCQRPQLEGDAFVRDVYAHYHVIDAWITNGRLVGPGLPATIRQQLEVALEQPETPAFSRQQRARGYLALKKPLEAIELLVPLVAAEPRNGELHNDLGVAHLLAAPQAPVHWLFALHEFALVGAKDTSSPAAKRNTVIVCRRLHLAACARSALEELHPDLTDPIEEAVAAPASFVLPLIWTADERRAIELQPGLARASLLLALPTEQPTAHWLEVATNLAEILYQTQGDATVREAVKPLLSSRAVQIGEIRSLTAQGLSAYRHGSLKESRYLYAAARKSATGAHSVFDEALIDVNAADTWSRSGNLPQAREALESALRIARAQQLLWLEARAETVYGADVALAGSFLGTLAHLRRARDLYRQIGADADTPRVLYYLGVYSYLAGDIEEALSLALEATDLCPPSDVIRLTQVHWLLSVIAHRKDELNTAIAFAQQAVAYSTQTDNPGLVSTANAELGSLEFDAGEFELAQRSLSLAAAALATIGPGLQQSLPQLALNLTAAKMALAQGNLMQAEHSLRGNLAIYRHYRLSTAQRYSETVLLLAETLARQGQLSAATAKMQELLAVIEADQNALAAERYELTFEDQRRKLYERALEFHLKVLHNDLGAWKLLQKYRAKLFFEYFARFSPPTQAVQPSAPPTLEVPDHVQVVEYLLGEEELQIWVLTSRQMTRRTVPIGRIELETKVQQFLQTVASQRDSGDQGTSLYAVLITPIQDLLDPARTLLLIPDLSLHRLPFAALRSPSTHQYLVEAYSLLESPSLRYFSAKQNASTAVGSVVGIGPRIGYESVQRELHMVHETYTTSIIMTGQGITKSLFLALMPSASLLHFAGHAIKDSDNPLGARLILDPLVETNNLSALDILQTRMRPKSIVVLSSCDTAIGNSRDGVGLRGLTTAFLVAGASTVVGSLWPVDSAATTQLMTDFHTELAKGQPVAASLRDSQLALLSHWPQWAHPYYWAGFVATGKDTTLVGTFVRSQEQSQRPR